MYKFSILFYFSCLILYILFSRQPDYFDGDFGTAQIHFLKDSVSGALEPYAVYQINKKEYAVNADYLFRKFNENDNVKIIYETSQPDKAAVYSWWGYWIKPGELFFSLVLFTVMLFIAVTITKNPSSATQPE